MGEVTAQDWDALQTLSRRVGLPEERVSLTRKRVGPASPRPGSPYVLVAGRPDAGIELTLARLISPDAAEMLAKGGERPLVLGPTPAEVGPRLGGWGTWRATVPGGHLIALRTSGKPKADALAQLATLGFIDALVLVTRLGQPMHTSERDIARSLSGSVAVVRVLVVGVKGEEPTPNDLAEVAAFAVQQMREAGFDGGRCLGAGVWFSGGDARAGTLADLPAFLTVRADEVAAGTSGMARQSLAALMAELRGHARKSAGQTRPAIPEGEIDRLAQELAAYLADLGRELERQQASRPASSVAGLRAYALDAFRGWGAYTTIEGHWLKYVERLLPGTQAAFLAEADGAVQLLDRTPARAPAASPSPSSPSPVDRVIVEGKRLAVGLACGLAGYLLVPLLLTNLAASEVPGLLVALIGYAVLALGTVLGYGVARSLFRDAPPPAAAVADPGKEGRDTIHGWKQVELRLNAWFGERFRTPALTPVEECDALAARLGIEDHHP